ncbi:MAG: rhomboid family intramembrane serine protease [Anaerolineae bacterium]|nr:rhomboid family intramembrane serine protease [Anaerolineae bacterium]
MSPTLIIFLYIFLQIFFLLPIKDKRSRRRGFPWVTTLLVALNVLIHVWVTFTIYQQPHEPDQPYWLGIYPFMEVPYLIINHEGLGALSALTSTYLHADTGHLLGNMFVLWFFGRKVEDATGHVSFALLYTLCGFTASLMSVAMNIMLTGGHIPGFGASGAIAGVMGAYLFLYSNEKVLTLVSTWLAPALPVIPGFCFIPLPIPLWLPAWVFILSQVAKDALLGQLAIEAYKLGQVLPLGVGVFAHIGGLLGGMLFIYLFIRPEVLAGQR